MDLIWLSSLTSYYCSIRNDLHKNYAPLSIEIVHRIVKTPIDFIYRRCSRMLSLRGLSNDRGIQRLLFHGANAIRAAFAHPCPGERLPELLKCGSSSFLLLW